MGKIVVDGTRDAPRDGLRRVSRSGNLLHQGPYSMLVLDGGGEGWVCWDGGRGQGSLTYRGRSYALVLRHVGPGRFRYRLLSDGREVGRGRVEEAAAPALGPNADGRGPLRTRPNPVDLVVA